MADGGAPERIEHGLVGVFQAVAGVHQHVNAREVGAPAQVVLDQLGPGRDLVLAAAA